MEHGLVFILDEQRFALPLGVVERVVRAVEITRFPEASPLFPGVIDVHGEVVPVIDLRARLGVSARPLVPGAKFVIAATARRRLALWVDQVAGVASWQAEDFVPAGTLPPASGHLSGVVRGGDGLVLVHDVDALLASDAQPLPEAESVGH